MTHKTVVLPTAPGQEPQVVHLPDPDGLSARGRFLATLLAAILLLVAAAGLAAADLGPLTGARVASTGQGLPAAGTEPDVEQLDDAIDAQWDAGTVHLDWTGREYVTVETGFIGDRVVSPGDRVVRTLHLGNAGPSEAVTTVSLLLDEEVPDTAMNPELSGSVYVFWQVGDVTGRELFATLLDDEQPVIAQARVAQGGLVDVTVGIEMPIETEGARSAGQDSRTLNFQVLVRMGDRIPSEPARPTPEPSPSEPGRSSPSVPGQSSPPVVVEPGHPSSDVLALTGTQIAALVLAAIGLAVLGWLLVTAVRRRRALERAGGSAP